jgi:hypothetical protein
LRTIAVGRGTLSEGALTFVMSAPIAARKAI